MIKVGIVDGSKKWLLAVSKKINSKFKEIDLSLYQSLNKLENNLDFAIIDTEVNNEDGIAFAKKHLDTKIIFLSDNHQRIKEAFGPNVYGFVSKANYQNELEQKMAEMIKIIKDNQFVCFKINRHEVLIRIEDIIYCQFLGGRVVSIVYQNKCVMVKNSTLKQVKAKLDDRFIEISRDTIVNKNKIIDFQDNSIHLSGVNSRFEVSVRNRKQIQKIMHL